MPTYEFKCGSCTHQFEVFQSMSDPDPQVCEACGANTLEKVLFPVAVHYKGSGFYSTDYSGSKPSGTGQSGSDSGTSTGSGEGGAAGSGDSGASSSGDASSGSAGSSSSD